MPGNINTSSAAMASRLMISIVQDRQTVGYRVLNLAEGAYRPLVKELGYRSVAADPSLAGQLWRPTLQLTGTNTPQPALRVEARLKGDLNNGALAEMIIPVGNLSWLARQMAEQLRVHENLTMHVGVLADDDPAARAWADQMQNDDFEVMESTNTELVLPRAFSTEPLGSRETIRHVGSWLRCVFTKRALATFLEGASQETSVERGWAALTRTHLTDACNVVIEELVEMPAKAGRSFMITAGHEFLGVCEKLGERLGGFCHLHPPSVNDAPLSPTPSSPDSVVAWNLDAATRSPIVTPIAMFGASAENIVGNVSAYGYSRGLLAEIDMEVLK